MTAKEYLNQARHLDALINCRLREIDYWRDLSSSVSGSNFEQHYNPNKPTEAPFVRCLEKIDAIQRDVAEKVAYLISLRDEINMRIDMLNSHEEQILLRYRYLDGFSWDEIEHMMCVCVEKHCASDSWISSSEFSRAGLKLAHFETFWDSMTHPSCDIITIAK